MFNIQLDKISERSFQSFILLILGIILSIVGAAEKIEISKISFTLQIADFYLKIIVTLSGVSLVGFGGYFLFNGSGDGKLKYINEKIEENMNKNLLLKQNVDILLNKIEKLEEDYAVLTTLQPINQDKDNIATYNNKKAFCIIDKQINFPVKPSKPEIKEALMSASPVAIREIFGMLKEHRRQMVLNLSTCNKTESKRIRDEISHLIIPLEVIARIEGMNAGSVYVYDVFANLAYIYKDLQNPLWSDALRFIKIAIEERNKIKSENERLLYIDYEINRMLCNINLEKRNGEYYENIDKDFKIIWGSGDGQNHIMDVPSVLFPKLYEWMVEYKIENMIDWLHRHPDKQNDWFNKTIPDQVKEKVKRKMK